jgi:uncharacterized membrane protein YkvA (DUF1232 family)
MGFIANLKQKVKHLKEEILALSIAYGDKRTPFVAKLMIGLTVGYLLSPIDLIPDFIPVIGFLDDLIIVPLLISVSIKLIPKVVLEDAREKAKQNPKKLKNNNWFFAAIIILIWVILLYFVYNKFARLIFNQIS